MKANIIALAIILAGLAIAFAAGYGNRFHSTVYEGGVLVTDAWTGDHRLCRVASGSVAQWLRGGGDPGARECVDWPDIALGDADGSDDAVTEDDRDEALDEVDAGGAPPPAK